jgi:multisubunit Na+/H+ antiporter MnhC subunit
MTWSKLADILTRYRHALTLAIAGAAGVAWAIYTQLGPVRLGIKPAVKSFVFVFVAVAVVVAVAFTILLVVAEVRAAKRSPDEALPRASARRVRSRSRESVSSPEPSDALSPAGAPAPEPKRPVLSDPAPAPGDEPRLLR